MVTDHQLRSLEIAKRRALWALADLQPGDPRAEPQLMELDEVDQALEDLLSDDELSSQQLLGAITTQFHNGLRLVIEDSIPEPWRQRFSAASVGSTRLAAGPPFVRWLVASQAKAVLVEITSCYKDEKLSTALMKSNPGKRRIAGCQMKRCQNEALAVWLGSR